MEKITNKHNFQEKIYLLFLILLCTSMVIVNCRGSVYSFYAFSYPPSSKPHEDNWEYLGKVIVASNEVGALSKKSKKGVQIIVVNKLKQTVLSDDLKFVCGSIDAKIIWQQFEEIEITLYEIGNPYAEDEYNKELIVKGPNRIAHLEYLFDNVSKKFKKIKNNYSNE